MSGGYAGRTHDSRHHLALPSPVATWAYFLDFDGTVVELAPTPTSVHADARIHAIVQDVMAFAGGALALISGRTIADLDTIFGRRDVAVAGQHGLERRRADGTLVHPSASIAALDDARAVLARAVRRFPSLVLEDKGHSIALHYRAAPLLASYAHQLMRVAQARAGEGYRVQRGKRVVELTMALSDKGTAIRAFLDELPFYGRLPVFIGDDQTDEAGFAVVNALGGISVKVGPGRTHARWRLPDVDAVRTWLSTVGDAPPSSDTNFVEPTHADA